MEKEVTIKIDEDELAALFPIAMRLKNGGDDILIGLWTRLEMAYDVAKPTFCERILSDKVVLTDNEYDCVKQARKAVMIAEDVFNHIYVEKYDRGIECKRDE